MGEVGINLTKEHSNTRQESCLDYLGRERPPSELVRSDVTPAEKDLLYSAAENQAKAAELVGPLAYRRYVIKHNETMKRSDYQPCGLPWVDFTFSSE